MKMKVKGQTVPAGLHCPMVVDTDTGQFQLLGKTYQPSSVQIELIDITRGPGVSVGGAALGAVLLGPVGLLAGARVKNRLRHIVVLEPDQGDPVQFLPDRSLHELITLKMDSYKKTGSW